MNSKQVAAYFSAHRDDRTIQKAIDRTDAFELAGYGQSNLGMLYWNDDRNCADQFEHFIAHYESVCPTYTYSLLKCPQLLLFIAAAAGLNDAYLDAAEKIIEDFEGTARIRHTEKTAAYMPGGDMGAFKRILRIKTISSNIGSSSTWGEVIEKTSRL